MGAVMEASPDKAVLLAEAAKFTAEWLEKADPDFKGASFIFMVVTQNDIFDMVGNDKDMILPMLLFAAQQAITGNGAGTIDLARTKQ